MADEVVIARLEAEIEEAGSQKGWAVSHGFSPQFVTDVLKGRRRVSDNLARALGFRRMVSWRDVRGEGRREGSR